MELAPDAPLPIYNLCFSLVANGEMDEARKVVAEWELRRTNTYVPPYFLAMANVAIGNIDAALELLETARAEFSAWVLWYGTEPKLDSVRSDPRYQKLMERTRLPLK